MSVVSPQHHDPALRRALAAAALATGALALVLAGCASPGLRPVSGGGGYTWFERPGPTDPWTPKIVGWQLRERAQPSMDELAQDAPAVSDGGRSAEPSTGESLRQRYFHYRAEMRRAMARDLADWMQSVAKRHYVPDGLVDHWATLEETLAHDGDDCDGLELMAFHFLRDHGFPEDEVFRAVVFRPADGQHHMVTLWFENPQDPWVIDPTGAMTGGMPRMSERSDWVPLKLFTDTESYTVSPRDDGRSGYRRTAEAEPGR